MKSFESGETSQLLLPLENAFQLTTADKPDAFRRTVFFEIARAYIKHHSLISKFAPSAAPSVADVQKWLESPILGGKGGGIGIPLLGSIQGSATESANTSPGFVEAGFMSTVATWLKTSFPSNQAGGFIAVIDNLELLETSQAARQLLEALRDSVLNQLGIRWVLCGARGIVRTVASSSRLEGVLAEPIELKPITGDDISEVLARRIEAYRMVDDAYAPVDPSGFKFIYEVLHENLRNTLRYCEDFALWMADQDTQPTESSKKLDSLRSWLSSLSSRYAEDTKSVGNRAWKVFDDMVNLGGSCSPSDHDKFKYKTQMALRPQIKTLEDAQLVQSSKDDDDARRKTIALTPRGWLVHFHRSGPKPGSST
ncbi:hypothetical protein [Myxococcus faecalis]|uniref:hypothetical protein n=1 Tax=Myxococcus faecalis TaxID=3115646 RepID=UPI003CFBC1D0